MHYLAFLVVTLPFVVRTVQPVLEEVDAKLVMTRTHARQLGLEPGAEVWLTPASGATTVPAMPGTPLEPAVGDQR